MLFVSAILCFFLLLFCVCVCICVYYVFLIFLKPKLWSCYLLFINFEKKICCLSFVTNKCIFIIENVENHNSYKKRKLKITTCHCTSQRENLLIFWSISFLKFTWLFLGGFLLFVHPLPPTHTLIFIIILHIDMLRNIHSNELKYIV